MDGRKAHRKRIERCVKCNSVAETEYHIVDEEEEVHVVQILPSRPINDDDHVYADRDIPRSSSSHNLSSICSGEANVSPRHPPRETPHTAAPAIRRDLKPSRQKLQIDKKAPTEPTEDQHTPRCSVPHTAFTWPGDDTNSCKKGRDQRSHVTADNIHNTSSSSLFEINSKPQSNQRYSLDLDICNKEMRSAHTQVPHEWPQNKKAFNKHVFPPVPENLQTYSSEGWYVGVCNRADAEHALHLVNKDGAFLVRDSTINTNTEPLVLVVYHDKKVYNVKIRYIESTRTFTLSKGRGSNAMFPSVTEMIRHHSRSPLPLINGRYAPGSKNSDNCVLTYPVTKGDVDKLLE